MARSGDNGAASTPHHTANIIHAVIRQAFDHINVRMSCTLARRAYISRRNCGSYLCRRAYSSIDAQRSIALANIPVYCWGEHAGIVLITALARRCPDAACGGAGAGVHHDDGFPACARAPYWYVSTARHSRASGPM